MEIRLSVMKVSTVNGKKTYSDFTFRLDPYKMAKKCRTQTSLQKAIEQYVAKNSTFKRDDLPNLKYNTAEFVTEWKKQLAVVKKEEVEKLQASEVPLESRITPDRITRLAPNEVFVFGSNSQGMHYGGAARQAVESFGAIMGQGHGMQGMSYAINSMSGMAELSEDVAVFCEYAQKHPAKRFFVTAIGCGIAGLHPSEVAPYFECCRKLSNVTLPREFWDVLGGPDNESEMF